MLNINVDSSKGTMGLDISGTGSTLLSELLSAISEIYKSLVSDGLEGAAFAALLESMLRKDKYWDTLHKEALENSEDEEEQSDENGLD